MELKGIYGPSSPSSKGDIQYSPATPLGTFGNLTALSYDWYRDSASTNSSAQVPVLRLYVQDPAHPATQRFMVFEPIYNDHTRDLATLTNQWVSENVFRIGRPHVGLRHAPRDSSIVGRQDALAMDC